MSEASPSLYLGAAYIRVSTDQQAELSPDAQLRVILDAAKADHVQIPEEFIFMEKRGISGRKAENRPEFQRMIAIARSQKPAPFTRLYLWKFSRFARNQEESVFYKGILRKKCGVEIKSVSEPIAEGMFGRLIETIIEWFDEYYSYNLSGEVLRGMREKALRHGYQTTPCLGYRAQGGGKPYVIDPEEYATVQFIHQSYHDGLDPTAIARACNRLGYRTKRGNLFERRTVLGILANPFYAGTVVWNGISFSGEHEISPSVSSIVSDNQKRLANEYTPKGRHAPSCCRHFLSGLFVCGICGASLSINRTGPDARRPDFFQCWKYAKGLHPGSCSITVSKAEAAVFASLKTVLGDGCSSDFYQKNEPSVSARTKSSLLLLSLSRLEQKEKRIRQAYESGVDTLEEYAANKQRLCTERQELKQKLSEERSRREPVPLPKETSGATAFSLLSDSRLDSAKKGSLLRQIIKKIVYLREKETLIIYYYLS